MQDAAPTRADQQFAAADKLRLRSRLAAERRNVGRTGTISMSRQQRHRSESRSTLEAEVTRFVENPVKLPAHVVRAVLDELTGDLGICLTARDFETIEADPPRDPQAFAELVLSLDGLGSSDPETFLPVLQRVLRTFQGATPR